MLVRLLFILRRRWPILLAVPLAVAVIGILIRPQSAGAKPRYSATGYVNVRTSVAAPDAQQALVDLKQGEGAREAQKLLGSDQPGPELSNAITTKFDSDNFVVTITATKTSKREAKRFADAFSRAFVTTANGAQAEANKQAISTQQGRLDKATEALNTFDFEHKADLERPDAPPLLTAQRQQLAEEQAAAQQSLTQAQANQQSATIYRLVNVASARAVAASNLQLPASAVVRMLLALLLGLLAAAGLIAFLERLNPRVDDPETAEELVGAPVLAMVPLQSRRARNSLDRLSQASFVGPVAEAYRALRTHLEFRDTADGRTQPARIMVTSATPQEGKTTSAGLLAVAFAEKSEKVIVIGGDVRRPRIHRLFGVGRDHGLTSLLPNSSGPDLYAHDPETGVKVISSGPSAGRVTNAAGTLETITRTGQQTGHRVVLDTAPVIVANDAVDFLPAVDLVVIVMRTGRSTVRSVRQMMSTLRLDQATVAGVVMVGSLESSDAKRYYYSYYSPDENGANDSNGERDRPSRFARRR